jgi:hypothetical protein
MGTEYTPVTRAQIEGRKKTVGPTALSAGSVTLLVSSAISGMVRHIVGVNLDNRSGENQCQLFVADASGLTSVISRIEQASWMVSGQEYKLFKEWHPDKEHRPYYDLQANEKLYGIVDSGYTYAKITVWDEDY